MTSKSSQKNPDLSKWPNWYEEETPKGSYRSLFKWGDLKAFKHPNRHLVDLMKEVFGMKDEGFLERRQEGLEQVPAFAAQRLSQEHISVLTAIVGSENALQDACSRIKASYGKGMLDVLRLRHQIVENLPDLVLTPRDKCDVEKIVLYCHNTHIPLYVYGAGSGVTRGTEAVQGGITIDLSAHMNRVLKFDEEDQTIQVEAGMMGPALEQTVQNATSLLNAKFNYTCGHFPQSFEYSSVGGWAVTRGAGQNSTYYGKIEDIVIAQEYVTPLGSLTTPGFARKATGPDIDQVMLGSEGVFGVLVNVTLRLRRYLPENRKYFGYMFKNWENALQAVRAVMQCECGYPSVFRLSDPEETEVAMRLYGVAGTPADTLLKWLDFQPMQRSLVLGTVDGEKSFCKNVNRNIRKIARQNKAFDLSLFGVAQRWEESRFRDPYMREDLHDFGIFLDTLECSVNWSQLSNVHQKVRDFIKKRPNTICMAHCSHFYPHGTNLYFIFIARMQSMQEYLQLQYGILDAIQESGAAISHHHGIGKQTASWFAQQSGELHMGVLAALKNYFDPHHILNPGGTLGLDMNEVQKSKKWGLINDD